MCSCPRPSCSRSSGGRRPGAGPRRLRLLAVSLGVVLVRVLFGLLVEAPGGMLVARNGAALGTGLYPGLCAALEGASFLEAPVPSLLHLGAPELVLRPCDDTLQARHPLALIPR